VKKHSPENEGKKEQGFGVKIRWSRGLRKEDPLGFIKNPTVDLMTCWGVSIKKYQGVQKPLKSDSRRQK